MLEKAIVRSLGKSSPNNKKFDKDYIIIFIGRKPDTFDGVKFYPAWTEALGDESNIDLFDDQLQSVSISEAQEFVDYYNKETGNNVVI